MSHVIVVGTVVVVDFILVSFVVVVLGECLVVVLAFGVVAINLGVILVALGVVAINLGMILVVLVG